MKILSRASSDPLHGFDPSPPQGSRSPELAQARRQRRVRRSLGVLVALAMVGGAVWVVGYSGLADPVLVALAPVTKFVKSAADDPKGALMIVGALVITKIGILTFIFDDRNY